MRYPLASFFLRADVAHRSKAAHIARSSPHQVVGIHHEKRFDVDEVLYQHCVKKLLVGYLEQIYRRWSSALIARTQSGVWMPHCTLAMRMDISRLSAAIAAAATWPVPWVATPVRLSGRGEGRGRTRQAPARHVDLAPGTRGGRNAG